MDRGDESDEEVYLSEAETDDTASIGPHLQDYEHSNDDQLDTGHESAQPSAQAEIDYALHDAEVARANERPSATPTKPTALTSKPEIPAETQAESVVRSTLSADAAPWVPPGYSGDSSSTQSATPSSEPATGISAAKVFTAVADPPVRSLTQSDQTKSDQAPAQTGPSHNSQEVQEKPKEASQEAEMPPAKSEETPPKQEEGAPASDVEHSSEFSRNDEPAKASEPAPSNGWKAADAEKEEPATETKENESVAQAQPSLSDDSRTPELSDLRAEEEVIEAIQNAGTPEEEAEVIASELPTAVSAQEELPEEEAPAETAVTGLNGEGRAPANGKGEKAEKVAKPSATGLNGGGETHAESAKVDPAGEEDAPGQADQEVSVQAESVTSEPAATISAEPVSSSSEITRDEPSSAVGELESDSSHGKENVEPSTQSDSAPSSSRTVETGEEPSKPSAGPSLPPRPAAKGRGSGLGTSLPPRGMPSLPARPARDFEAACSPTTLRHAWSLAMESRTLQEISPNSRHRLDRAKQPPASPQSSPDSTAKLPAKLKQDSPDLMQHHSNDRSITSKREALHLRAQCKPPGRSSGKRSSVRSTKKLACQNQDPQTAENPKVTSPVVAKGPLRSPIGQANVKSPVKEDKASKHASLLSPISMSKDRSEDLSQTASNIQSVASTQSESYKSREQTPVRFSLPDHATSLFSHRLASFSNPLYSPTDSISSANSGLKTPFLGVPRPVKSASQGNTFNSPIASPEKQSSLPLQGFWDELQRQELMTPKTRWKSTLQGISDRAAEKALPNKPASAVFRAKHPSDTDGSGVACEPEHSPFEKPRTPGLLRIPSPFTKDKVHERPQGKGLHLSDPEISLLKGLRPPPMSRNVSQLPRNGSNAHMQRPSDQLAPNLENKGNGISQAGSSPERKLLAPQLNAIRKFPNLAFLERKVEERLSNRVQLDPMVSAFTANERQKVAEQARKRALASSPTDGDHEAPILKSKNDYSPERKGTVRSGSQIPRHTVGTVSFESGRDAVSISAKPNCKTKQEPGSKGLISEAGQSSFEGSPTPNFREERQPKTEWKLRAAKPVISTEKVVKGGWQGGFFSRAKFPAPAVIQGGQKASPNTPAAPVLNLDNTFPAADIAKANLASNSRIPIPKKSASQKSSPASTASRVIIPSKREIEDLVKKDPTGFERRITQVLTDARTIGRTSTSSQDEAPQQSASSQETRRLASDASDSPSNKSAQQEPQQAAAAPTPAPSSAPTQASTNEQPPARAAPVPPQQVAPAVAAPQSAVEQPTESDQVKNVRAKLRDLRIQLFRLAKRLKYENHNLVKTIKYRLDHAERVRLSAIGAQDDLVAIANDLERQNSEEAIYEVTVMVIGITGTGKSAMINSLLGYDAVTADAFEGTTSVKEVSGTEFGLKLKLIDTPGLSAAADAASYNNKVLKSIDKARKKYKPDLVIYCERQDVLRRDLSDLPILRRLTETLGSEVWFNTLLVFTHAESQLYSPRGEAFPFEQLSQTRAAMFQRALQATVGDGRINVPTTFAENSPACRKNEQGESVLPNNLAWRRFILMYLASIKVLREADSELQSTAPKKENKNNAMDQLSMLLQAQRGVKLPPLPFLITTMIKHAGPKQYPQAEQDIKREDEIKAIRRFGLRRKEFRKRTNFLKNKQAERRMVALGKESDEPEIDPYEPPNPGPALSPTFDSDENSLYYRAYEPRGSDGGWLTRPRLEQNTVDHTDGVESLTTERTFVRRGKGNDLDGIPSAIHAIVQKDKFNQLFQGGAEASVYQNYKIVHTGRAQVMTLSGGDILYITQLETLLKQIPRNKLTIGGMLSRLAEADSVLPLKGKVAVGMKLENEFDLPDSKTYNLKNNIKAGIGRGVIKLGQGRKEQATGLNAEWQLTGGARENIQVMGSFSQMQYRGNKGKQYSLSANIPVTDETTLSPKLQLQGGQGSLTVRVASHDHSNMGLLVFAPLAKALFDRLRNRQAESNQQALSLN